MAWLCDKRHGFIVLDKWHVIRGVGMCCSIYGMEWSSPALLHAEGTHHAPAQLQTEVTCFCSMLRALQEGILPPCVPAIVIVIIYYINIVIVIVIIL